MSLARLLATASRCLAAIERRGVPRPLPRPIRRERARELQREWERQREADARQEPLPLAKAEGGR